MESNLALFMQVMSDTCAVWFAESIATEQKLHPGYICPSSWPFGYWAKANLYVSVHYHPLALIILFPGVKYVNPGASRLIRICYLLSRKSYSGARHKPSQAIQCYCSSLELVYMLACQLSSFSSLSIASLVSIYMSTVLGKVYVVILYAGFICQQ
jgi:hypothetical protein